MVICYSTVFSYPHIGLWSCGVRLGHAYRRLGATIRRARRGREHYPFPSERRRVRHRLRRRHRTYFQCSLDLYFAVYSHCQSIICVSSADCSTCARTASSVSTARSRWCSLSERSTSRCRGGCCSPEVATSWWTCGTRCAPRGCRYLTPTRTAWAACNCVRTAPPSLPARGTLHLKSGPDFVVVFVVDYYYFLNLEWSPIAILRNRLYTIVVFNLLLPSIINSHQLYLILFVSLTRVQ